LDNLLLYLSPVYFLICLLSPEINLALLLYIGRIGFEPRLALIEPFSLNQLNLLIFAWHFWKVQKDAPDGLTSEYQFIKPYLPFILYLGLNALIFSHYPDYALRKLTSLFFMGTIAAMFLHLIYRTKGRRALARTLTAFALIAFAISGLAFIKIIAGLSETRLTVLQGGPIVLGRINGLAILMIAGYYYYTNSRKLKFGLIAIGTIIFFTQIWTLSKGPVLALYLTLGLAILIFNKKGRLTGIMIMTIGAALILTFTLSSFDLDSRYFMNPFTQSTENTYRIRWLLFTQAFENIRHHFLLGTGLGNFIDQGVVYGVLYKYPHNLFLEIFSETGVIGFLLFGTILVGWFRRIQQYLSHQRARDPLTVVILLICVYMGVNQMVSGDLTAARFFWFFLFWSDLMLKEENNNFLTR